MLAEEPKGEPKRYTASRLVARLATISGVGWPLAVFVSWVCFVIANGDSVADSILQGLTVTYFLGAAGCFGIYFGKPLNDRPSPTALRRAFFSLAELLFFVVLFTAVFALRPVITSRLLVVYVFFGASFLSLGFYVMGTWLVLVHDEYQGVNLRDVASKPVLMFASFSVWLLVMNITTMLRPFGTYDAPTASVLDFLWFAVPILAACAVYWGAAWKLGHDSGRKVY